MKSKKSFQNNENLFSFSLSQKRGVFLLLCIMLLLLIGIIVSPLISQNTTKIDFTEFENQIALYEKSLIREDNSNKKNLSSTNAGNSQMPNLSPFPFNPNTLTSEDGKKLGLKEYQTKSILKYLSKGGKFYKKEDFKKMYCISDREYDILEPYINIPIQPRNSFTKNIEIKKEALYTLELNSADTTDLKKLKGIGSVYANRIIKYRNLLGGFYSTEQLLEVWGFTPEMLDKIKDVITVDINSIKKININTVNLDRLRKHPYLDFYLAKNIIKYRDEKGFFKTVEDLLKINLMYEDTFGKIKYYLIVQ